MLSNGPVRFLCHGRYALLLVLVVVAAMPAGAAVLIPVQVVIDSPGLDGAGGVAVSADGAHVYVTGLFDDALVVFAREGTIGTLTFVEVHRDDVSGVDGLSAPQGVVVSRDGAYVYVAGSFDSAVAVFARDAVSGSLTFVEAQRDGLTDEFFGVGPDAVALSPDEAHLYVTGSIGDVLAVFARSAGDGKLALVEVQRDGVGGVGGLGGANAVVVSPGGRHVYVTGADDDAVAVFSRDGETGALTWIEVHRDGIGGVDGLKGASAIAVSGDGSHVYVTSGSNRFAENDDSVAVFARQDTSGTLTFVEWHRDRAGGVDGLRGTRAVLVSPDGKYVFTAAGTSDAVVGGDDAIAVFARSADSGALTWVEALQNGVGGVAGLDGAHSLAVSPGGSHLYAASELDDAVTVFEVRTETPTLTPGGPSTPTGTPTRTPTQTATPITPQSIACGQTIDGVLDPTDPDVFGDETFADVYAFTLGVLSTVRAALSGVGFEPFLSIGEPGGTPIFQGLSPQEGALPSGAYWVIANNFLPVPPDSYPYQLTLSCTEGTPAASPTPTRVPPVDCPGDCNDDGSVSVAELIRAVNIALGTPSVDQCPAVDVNHDTRVSISELIGAVLAALRGCEEQRGM